MVNTTFDEPNDGGLPGALRERLDAFPVGAVRDQADRLAAVVEELTYVDRMLGVMGVTSDERRRLLDRYLQALYDRLDVAAGWAPRQRSPQKQVVAQARPRPPAFRVVRRLRPTTVWMSNRRVGWRRRKWRRLLAG
jgi:hypothetical protein